MHAGDVIELKAGTLGKDGLATGEHDGVPVRARGLLPDEIGRVHVEHVGRHRAHGRAVEVLQPSTSRRPAPCRHQGDCGGCPLMIAGEDFVAAQKRAMLAELGIHVGEVVGDERSTGYRWSSKRVVGGAPGALVVGSYRPGSHRVAPMQGCLVDHPDIAACFDELEAVGSALGVVPFDAPSGDLRFAWAKTDGEGRVLLTLVTGGGTSRAPELAAALERPTGVAWCVQDAGGNAMRGGHLRHLRGEETLRVALGGYTVELGPLGFLQPNPPVAALAYADLVRGAPTRAPDPVGLAFDLYAGAGVTTRMLREQYDEVRVCESYPESAAALGVEPQTAESFLATERATPRLIVANPPRAGLGAAVCDALRAVADRADDATFLHVMSCEPHALARDLERLTAGGAFEIIGARAYDTLPQTAHIELVAWLVSKKNVV